MRLKRLENREIREKALNERVSEMAEIKQTRRKQEEQEENLEEGCEPDEQKATSLINIMQIKWKVMSLNNNHSFCSTYGALQTFTGMAGLGRDDRDGALPLPFSIKWS